MSRTAAFEFLCECLSCPGEPESLRRRVEARDFRWTSFATVAHEYLVASAVPFSLQDIELRKALPQATLEYFDGVARTVRRCNAQVMDEAVEVAAILNRIGVTPVFLKGGANLLRGLYPDPAMRQMVDLDVLVPHNRIDDCIACLHDDGFRQLHDYRHPRAHHAPALGRPNLPLPIELHHQVLAHPYNKFLTAEEVQTTSVILDGYDSVIAVPSVTCSFIQNVAHAQLGNHDYLYGRIDLRALLDFSLLAKIYAQEIDWDAIRRRFSRCGGGTALNFHLLCARNLLRVQMGSSGPDTVARFLYWRALYLIAKPKLLDLGVRLTRPWLLVRRELSDAALRRRLVGNVTDQAWWARHLRLLAGRE